ncbi:cytochrome P450 CYP12A2-like [Teleopsis dalmanni]|uniref:cytochrome P450 CYP12A2-like n=1 Tax=Teleopsis dalmanni TaxID=139649 RepID=UPI0018CF635A|nr:cytochrome P450 CYP12A2-like [Teleopsis dalmanni]
MRAFSSRDRVPIAYHCETIAYEYHREKHRRSFFQGSDGIISTKGEKWGSFRSAINPVLMHPKKAKIYLPKMCKINTEFGERIGEIPDPKTLKVPEAFEDEINRWTLESISMVAHDQQLGLINPMNRKNPVTKKLFVTLIEFFFVNGGDSILATNLEIC